MAGNPSKVTILLVDDHQADLRALAAILNRPDYELLLAHSGDEALVQLLTHDVGLILLDVMMPGMSGFELASIIKGRQKTRSIPIIFVTAVAKDVREIYRGYSVGAVDYIEKPLDPGVVRAKVGVFVELFRSKEEIRRQADLIQQSERAKSLERERESKLRAEAAERRYYDLINWVDHAVLWEYDPIERRFVFVSRRSIQILGFDPEDWLNLPDFFFDHIPPEDRAAVQKMMEVAIRDGTAGRVEHRFYNKTGHTLWIHTGVNPRKDPSGKVTLLWGLTLDITGFKTAEQNQRFLAQASGLLSFSLDYRATLEKVAQLAVPTIADLCIVDIVHPRFGPTRIVAAGDLPEWTARAREIEAFSPGSKVSSPILKVIATGEPLLLSRVSDTDLNAFAVNEEHLRLLRELNIQSVMVVPLRGRDARLGAVTLRSCNPHRIYSRKDLEFAQELAWHATLAIDNSQLYREAQTAVKIREQVLATVSHDLKGPLSVISLNAEMMQRNGLAKNGRKELEKILSSTGKMQRLIRDLLDLERVSAGHLELQKKPQVAQRMIEEAIEALSPTAHRKSISIEKDVPESPLELSCDHDRVMQILSNLLGNAVKFTSEKGLVSVGCRSTGSETEFWVSDNGPGIASGDLPHIFERFRQTQEGKRHKEGSGLGLYIAREMVRAHHGRIWAESAVGKGTTLRFTLPIRAGAETAAA